MIVSNNLFDLIKSMEKAERKNFRLSGTMQGGDKIYLKLFDAIDEQEVYNEYQIKELFKGTKSIRHFSSIKVYLYKLIKKSLLALYADKHVDARLSNDLNFIQILHDKRLFSQCSVIIRKAKKIAAYHNKNLYLMEIANWEMKLIKIMSGPIAKIKTALAQKHEEVQVTLNNIQKFSKYRKLTDTIALLNMKRESSRAFDKKSEVRKIPHIQLLKVKGESLQYFTRIYFLLANSLLANINDDLKGSYKYRKELVDLQAKKKEIILEDARSYLESVHNLIQGCQRLKKYNEALHYIEQLKNMNLKSSKYDAIIFVNAYHNELIIHSLMGQYDKALAIIDVITAGLNEFKDKINRIHELLIHYDLAVLYFTIENYDEAVNHINIILNEQEELRQDVQCFAQIMNVFVHYELGNEELIEYKIRSTYRYLYKRNQIYKVEALLLKFLRRKVPKINTQKDLINAFTEAKIELENIAKDPFENRALEYFDFVSWLKSKIENRPFAEIVKEKAKEL